MCPLTARHAVAGERCGGDGGTGVRAQLSDGLADVVLLLIAALRGVEAVVEVVHAVIVAAHGAGVRPVHVLVAAGRDAGGEGCPGSTIALVVRVVLVVVVSIIAVVIPIAVLRLGGGEGGEEGGGCEDLLHGDLTWLAVR